jgi:hypothetical protein
MSFRRAAGTVARRWLAGGEVSSGGAGRFGSGGHEFVAGRVARFWSFGGSKGDGEDGGEDGAKGDRDAGKVSEASASVEAGALTERPEAGTSEARLVSSETDRLSPESKSPRWNVPDDFAETTAAETNVVPHSANDASVETNVVNRGNKQKKKKKRHSGDPTVTSSVERFGRRVKNDSSNDASLASSAPRNLYVKNLPRDFNAKKLAHLFMPHGDVQSTKFVLDAGPVPTGLVRFATAEEAAAATAALHGATLSADDAESSATDSGSESSEDSDSHTALSTQTVRLEISLAMTRAERDAARVARAEEREKRKQRRAERAERVKRLAASRTSGDKSLAKDGFAVRVTHVPVGLDHKQLRSIFVAFGKLGRVKMMWPNGEVPSAVVTFRDEAAANAAAASLAGEYLPGCKGPMAFEAHKSARGTRKKTRTKERGVKKKSEEEEGEESSESSDESSDSSSSESENESASPSSELSPNEALNSVEEGEEVAPLFVLRPESVTITDKITARADAARAAAGRVWRDVQASRAVSSPEALEKAKALNAAATARAKALRDEKRERGEPLANVGSDSNSAVAPADLLRRRREARGVFADTPHAAQTESRARRGLNPGGEQRESRRVRAYAERRHGSGADLSPRARVGHALVAGPGVDANTALSEEARAKLAAAAARKRARGRGVGFADSMAEMRGFGGRGGSGSRRSGSRGGPGGGGGGGSRSDARSARNSRRGRDGDSLDEKTRAALAARVEEARRASASESPWEWDVATFESGARKTFGENFNVAEYASAPVVPGFGVESNVSVSRAYTTSDEDAFLESRKAFIQQQGGIESDAQFESVKRDALASFARYKSLYEKQRETRGESPIEGDFLAERQTLLDAVSGVSETNPLRSFATRAADALDGNAGWSYARKVAALRFLASKAERYENAESAE